MLAGQPLGLRIIDVDNVRTRFLNKNCKHRQLSDRVGLVRGAGVFPCCEITHIDERANDAALSLYSSLGLEITTEIVAFTTTSTATNPMAYGPATS